MMQTYNLGVAIQNITQLKPSNSLFLEFSI